MAKIIYSEDGRILSQRNRGILILGIFFVLLPLIMGLFLLISPLKASADTMTRNQAIFRQEVVLECTVSSLVSRVEVERLLEGEYWEWLPQGTLKISKSGWDILNSNAVTVEPLIDSQREYWERPEGILDRFGRESCSADGVLLPNIDEAHVYDWASTYGCVPGSDPVVTAVCVDVKINHECPEELVVIFTNDIHSETLWNRWGSGCGDGGHDDDTPSDNDIELWDYCITSTFDGDPVEDDWFLDIYDQVAPYGCGECYLAYYEVTVYYEGPQCYVYPDELYFDVEIGSCESHSFYIENTGGDVLEGGPPQVFHPSYSLTPNEGYSLSAGETKFYQVQFCPTACGDVFTSVFLDSPCENKPSLNGDVKPDDPFCVIEPLELQFDVSICGGEETETFKIRNDGCGTLTGSTPIPGHGSFTISPSQGYSLGPSEEMEYSVTFHAAQCGNIFTSVFLDTPCDDDPHLVGHGPQEPNCAINPLTLNFYVADPHSSQTDTQLFTVTNDGCCDLVVSGIDVSSDDPEWEQDSWSLSPSSFTVAPGDGQSVQATWAPESYGDCHIVVFDLGVGCDPIMVDANACTPVAVSLFDLEVQGASVSVRWEADVDPTTEFRLTGSCLGESWELPFTHHEEARFYSALDRNERLARGGTFTYKLEGRDEGEDWSMLRSNSVDLEATPQHIGLVGAFPNPFNPTTTVVFNLDIPQRVRVRVVDLSGREIITIDDRQFPSGRNELTWRGADSSGNQVTSGIYLLQVMVHGKTESAKLVLLR